MRALLATDDLARLDLQTAGVGDSVSAALSRLDLPDAPRVLELGCGTGVLTAELLRALPAAVVDAVDQDRQALQTAAERVDGAVSWHWSTAGDHLREYSDYHLVICRLFLMHQPAPAALMRTARRSLAVGGALVAIEFDLGAALWHPTCPSLERVLRAAGDCTARARDAGIAVPDPFLGRQLVSLARRSGYDRWHVQAVSRTVTADSGEQVDREARNLLGVLAMVQPLLLATGDATGEDFDAVTELVHGWSDSPDFFSLQTMLTLVATLDRQRS